MPQTCGEYWYEQRDELESGQVFVCQDGSKVKLERRVPGDVTRWYVADSYGVSWAYEDSTIEPSDLSYIIT